MASKIPIEDITITKLAKYHDMSSFDCASETEHKDLNDFIKNDALRYQEEGLAVTYLCIYQEKIIGFVTLCSDSVKVTERERDDIKDGVALPEMPALKIARLAVDKNYTGRDIGTNLVLWSLYIAKKIKEIAGMRIVAVEAKRGSIEFYKRMGFRDLEKYDNEKRKHPYLYIDILKAKLV